MAYAREGGFRGIIWLVLVVFYMQTLNPVMLGYAPPWQGSPPTRTETAEPSVWQRLLDFALPAAQAATPAKPAQTSVVFAQRTPQTYKPAYAQPQANGDPLLASTPEFDLADPYLVAKANELGKDPQRIFAFVRDAIGFESYVGSLRGARGALWSNAGNALDQASLLVALLRISGIPARYAQGTLAKDKAQELIASMFLPAPYRVVGFVPDNAEKSDPVNDPALIAEASQHFWVEFQQGGGFVAADPAFRTAQLGQTFTAASGQFAAVPDNLRHKVAVRLQAETGGNAFSVDLQKQKVLDYTFTSAELVGKPLSIGHFVSSSAQGGIIGANYTHTYSPYLLVGQNDGDISDDPIIRGQDYQEFLSSIFGSLANSVVTGVFLEMDVIQPGGQKETFERALVDRIGFAARENGQLSSSLQFDSPEQPALLSSDVTTINIESSWYDSTLNGNRIDERERLKADIEALSIQLEDIDFSNPTADEMDLIQQLNQLTLFYMILLTHSINASFSEQSRDLNPNLEILNLVKAYHSSPRIIMIKVHSPKVEGATLKLAMDLTHNKLRSIVYPEQWIDANINFHMVRGFAESALEDAVMASIFKTDGPENTHIKQSSVNLIFQEAINQGIDLAVITHDNYDLINTLNLSSEAKARIGQAIKNKNEIVVVPKQMIAIAGKETIGWFEINPITGTVIDTNERGEHNAIIDYTLLSLLTISVSAFFSIIILETVVLKDCRITDKECRDARKQHFTDLLTLPVMGSGIVATIVAAGTIDATVTVAFATGFGIVLASIFFGIYLALELFDPPLPLMLVGLPFPQIPSIPPGTQPGFNTEVLPETLFTLPTNSTQLASLYRLHIQNTGPAAATYRVAFPNQPAGFTVKSSLPEVTIPAGETGVVGIMLIPNAGLPAPGTQAPFQVTITDTATNQTQTTPTTTFTTPDVVGVTLEGAPAQTTTAPGGTVNATLTVKSVGNVAAANIPLALQASTGLSVSGLPATVSLALGETKTIPLTLTATGALNDTLTATMTASFGKDLDGNPYQASATVGVTLASATAQAAFCGVQPASEAARSNLAATLNNLGIVLNQLEKEPGNAAYRDRAVALLDSLIGQLNGPALTPLVADLTAARNALANATPDALASLQNQLNRLCTTLTSDEGLLPFELTLWPASGVAQPGSPARFYLQLRNNGAQAATFNLSLGTLPAGVTGQLNRSSVTLNAGETTSVDQGQQLYVTLTPSTQAIQTFEFTVTAALTGSTLSRSVQGILLARPETLQITNVKATPGFTEPGGTVQISAEILSAINQSRSLQATYTVKNAGGTVVFTSTPKAFTPTVAGTLAPVDLGALNTTGYAKETYTLTVTLAEIDGTPLAGISGQGSLLVGTPLAASLSLNPQVVSPGNATTQANLTLVGQNIVQNPQMRLLTQIDTNATARSVAVQGDYAYVCGTEDITIINISDLRHPQIVATLADDVINDFLSVCRIIDNHLIINGQEWVNAGSLRVLIFDLTNPAVPTLVSQKDLPYRFIQNYWYSKGRMVFVPFGTLWSLGGQQGDFAAFDYSDFSDPKFLGALYGFQTDAGGIDGGGPDQIRTAIPIGARYALLGLGDSQGSNDSSRGRILTVDTLNPAQMSVVHETTVPGTKYMVGLGLVDQTLWVLGTNYSTAEWEADFPYPDITLSAFDATNPLDLKLLKSIPMQGITSTGMAWTTMTSLGNGFIAINNLQLDGNPVLMVVDVNDPLNPRYSTLAVAANLGEIQRRGNIVFAASDAGLGLYDIGQVLGLSYTAQVQIPKNTGVSVVPNSFNIAPTRIDSGSNYDTLVWERTLNNARPQDTLSWQLQATNLAPAEIRPVTGDTVIAFTTSTDDTGQVKLPPAELVARQIFTLTPPSRTVKPGETASYTVGIENPSNQPVTYTLSVQGVPSGWAQLASPVTIPAQGNQSIPLNLVTTATSETGQYGFVVTAVANTGFSANLLGGLILQQTGGGTPPDLGPDVDNPAKGVSITLTPAQATAGLGTAANFVARVVNLGDETTTFNLTGAFPAGFTAALGETSVTLLPGLSNYRDVTLTLTPPVTTNPGDYSFTATATAAGAPTVTDQAAGTVRVVNLGVDVDLTPDTASPPATLSLKVTNTGRVQETYKLELAGPAALYTPLPTATVTLAPGASQTLTLNVGAITTALPGDLTLTAIATAQSNPSVRDSDTSRLGINPSRGLEVAFDPNSQTLPAPGPATFLMRVQNTGNREEAYQAVITTTNGPVSAALEGLDGQPTQRIATFRLPALATGLLTLDTTLQQADTGQVTVTVTTLDAPALTDADTATLNAQNQVPGDSTAIPTLNEWMQLLMALLMLLALAWVSRRRYHR